MINHFFSVHVKDSGHRIWWKQQSSAHGSDLCAEISMWDTHRCLPSLHCCYSDEGLVAWGTCVLINSCLSLYCLHDFLMLISKENFTETYTVHCYQKTLPFFPHCSTHRTFKSSHLLSPILVQLPTTVRIITVSTSMSCDFTRLSWDKVPCA